MSVVEALERLQANEAKGAIVALLAVWTQTRHARVADAIDRLSERYAPDPAGPEDAALYIAGDDAWQRRFAAADPLELGLLLRSLRPSDRPNERGSGLDALSMRLELLRGRPDPRASYPMLELLQDTSLRYEDPGRLRACIDKAALVLLELRDLRFATAIEQLDELAIEISARALASLISVREELKKVRPIELDSASLEALRRIEDQLWNAPRRDNAPSIRDMLDAVYDDPASDDARAVLADRLQEAGHPFGELIALQLRRAGTKKRASERETMLFVMHRKWRAALEPHQFTQETYRRGFLADAVFGYSAPAAASAHRPETHPRGIGTQREWNTVERLSFWPLADLPPTGLLRSRELRALREVEDVSAGELLAIDLETPLPWTSLSFDRVRTGRNWPSERVNQHLEHFPDVLPKLTSLTLPDTGLPIAHIGRLLDNLRLRSFSMVTSVEHASALVAAAQTAGVQQLGLLGPANLTIDLESKGLTMFFSPPMKGDAGSFALGLLRATAPLSLRTLEVALPPRTRTRGRASTDRTLPQHVEVFKREIDLDPIWRHAADSGMSCKTVPKISTWALSPGALL